MHSEYVIHIAFPRQQLLRERATMLLRFIVRCLLLKLFNCKVGLFNLAPLLCFGFHLQVGTELCVSGRDFIFFLCSFHNIPLLDHDASNRKDISSPADSPLRPLSSHKRCLQTVYGMYHTVSTRSNCSDKTFSFGESCGRCPPRFITVWGRKLNRCSLILALSVAHDIKSRPSLRLSCCTDCSHAQ